MTELELELAVPYCRAKVHSRPHFNTSLCSECSSAPQSPKKGTDPHAAESSCITAGSRGRRRQRLSPPRRGVSFLRVGSPSPRFPGRKTLRKSKVLSNGVSRAGMQEVGAGGSISGPSIQGRLPPGDLNSYSVLAPTGPPP